MIYFNAKAAPQMRYYADSVIITPHYHLAFFAIYRGFFSYFFNVQSYKKFLNLQRNIKKNKKIYAKTAVHDVSNKARAMSFVGN